MKSKDQRLHSIGKAGAALLPPPAELKKMFLKKLPAARLQPSFFKPRVTLDVGDHCFFQFPILCHSK